MNIDLPWDDQPPEAEATSLREKLAIALFLGPMQVEDPERTWESAAEVEKNAYRLIADSMKPHIIEWTAAICSEAVIAGFSEGLTKGLELATSGEMELVEGTLDINMRET
jgi:hypothetical protein